MGFPSGSQVKNLPAMQETRVRSLGHRESQEEGMATHSSTLAWRITWTEEPGRLYSPQCHTELDTTEATKQQQLESVNAARK